VAENEGDRSTEMIDWNEANFLERLTPQLRQKSGGAKGPCPDAETLCGVLEGDVRGPLRKLVIEHLTHCPQCAELRSRLLNFDSVSPPEPEAVWNQTQTRLDNWLEGFLRSEAAHSRSPKGGKPSRRVSGWESISNFFTPGKIIWALGVAVALVLIVDGVLLLEYRQEQLRQVQVAARATVPPKPPEKSTEKPKITPREEGLPKAGQNFPSRPESPNRPKAGEPKAPVAPALTPAPANHHLPSQIRQATPPPPPNPALPSAPPDHNLPTETAQATVPSPPNPTPRAVARPTGPALNRPWASTRPGATARAARNLPVPPSLPRNAAPATAIRHPPRLWLDPAGRLLIVLSSISRKPDGSFQFRGMLLLPVAQPGPVPLDRGAEVIGVGTRSQGQTSLAVTDLVVQGVRYTLKDGSGVMNAQTPGAGGGVHFDRSQVLDMWPTATAVYEKTSDQTGQPEPQK